MAKDFSKLSEDNPVMAILGKAKEEEAILKQQEEPVAETKVEPVIEKASEDAPVVEAKKILMNISIRESTKKEWKMFFLEHDLSMTQGIETAVEYLMSEVRKNNIKLSKGGITK